MAKSFLPLSPEAYGEIKEKLKFAGKQSCISRDAEGIEEVTLPGASISLRQDASADPVHVYLVYQGKVIHEGVKPEPEPDPQTGVFA